MADDVFLKLTGIEGESQDDVHLGEIQVTTYSLGSNSTVGSGAVKGTVSVQNLHFTKCVDSATAQMMKCHFQQRRIPKATLSVRKAASGSPLDYFVIELIDVAITSQSTSYNQNDELVQESVTLSFRALNVKYTKQSNEGDQNGGVEFGWNLAQNKAA
jgi:type VI secretion system secreted protein Hcp